MVITNNTTVYIKDKIEDLSLLEVEVAQPEQIEGRDAFGVLYAYSIDGTNFSEYLSKDEIQILLYSLAKTSSNPGSVVSCTYDTKEISDLMDKFRRGILKCTFKKDNNAAGYFIAVLKTLLVVDESHGSYVVSEEFKVNSKGVKQ